MHTSPTWWRPRNLTDIKTKTGNLYESIAIVAKRANQINISLKEELHNKLEEFASIPIVWKRYTKTKSRSKSPRPTNVCPTRLCWPPRNSWTIRSTIARMTTIFSNKPFYTHATGEKNPAWRIRQHRGLQIHVADQAPGQRRGTSKGHP